MAKNGFLTRLQSQQKIALQLERERTIQWCADAWIMAINDVFKRKGHIVTECAQRAMQYAHDISEMTFEDAKGDRSLEYTKSKVDERLKEILGEDFQPWEDRYV